MGYLLWDVRYLLCGTCYGMSGTDLGYHLADRLPPSRATSRLLPNRTPSESTALLPVLVPKRQMCNVYLGSRAGSSVPRLLGGIAYACTGLLCAYA
eukprot:3368162-Rhodomonas_salina.1